MAGLDEMHRIQLLGFPLKLMDRARQHMQALRREMAFIEHSDPESDVPARLLEIAAVTDEHYADLNPESEQLCDEALARGEEFIDLEVFVPTHFRDHILNSVPVLLEVEQYCRNGQMLTLMLAADLRGFWEWYLLEFIRQIDGQEPVDYRNYSPAIVD